MRSIPVPALLSVFLAAAAPASAQSVLSHMPGSTYTQTGDSSSGMGDISFNGRSEIVQGSPTAPRGGRLMFFYDDGTIIREMTLLGTEDMGRSVDGGDFLCGGGDVNADGFGDAVGGAPGTPVNGLATGAAVVFSGAGGADPLLVFYGAHAGDRFGADVAMVGRVDGDGKDDVMVGAPEAVPAYVEVYSGADGHLIHHFTGLQDHDGFGSSVSAVGDLDSDGRSELIVGAPRFDGEGADSGIAVLYSGRTGEPLYAFPGTAPGQGFGVSATAAGDVDGDGVPDLIVGGDGGIARVFSGADGHVLHALTGPGAFGHAVTGVGDQDGDGRGDFLVGAPYAAGYQPDSGNATLYSGRDGHVLYQFVGHQHNELFGEEVAIANDTNGDGWMDFLIGALGDQKTMLCTYRRPSISGPTPGQAGFVNNVQVGGVWPGWTVTLEYSYYTAFRPVIGCDGLHFDVASWPFLPSSLVAGANGLANFRGLASAALSGKTIYLQASIAPADLSYIRPWAVTDRIQYTFP